MLKSIEIYNKIKEVLYSKKISHKEVSQELGITQTAFSLQLTKLKNGKGINTETLEVIEKLSGFNFFCF